jgi:predicted nucleic acid-binding protein
MLGNEEKGFGDLMYERFKDIGLKEDEVRRFNEASDLLGGRVLDFDRRAAFAAAEWFGICRRIGRRLQATDMQIAGIAICRNVPLATRDVDDFADISVKLINPWNTAI